MPTLINFPLKYFWGRKGSVSKTENNSQAAAINPACGHCYVLSINNKNMYVFSSSATATAS
jgi:hypothetical protein